MSAQPDNTSCGPASLHSIYHFLGEEIPLKTIIQEISQFEAGGGTLGVILAKHALSKKFKVTLHSYNLNIFDPSWIKLTGKDLTKKLSLRIKKKDLSPKERIAHQSYIDFIQMGGILKFQDLSPATLIKYLNKGIPLLVGLSATWLYQAKREDPIENEYDDICGDPAGHFVVIHGYNAKTKLINVADPYIPNPIHGEHFYKISIQRIITSILLGVMTFDGNILVIEKA